MQTVGFVVGPARTALAALLIGSQFAAAAPAADRPSHRLVIAQGGGFERLPPSIAPTPYSQDAPSSVPSTPPPRNDSRSDFRNDDNRDPIPGPGRADRSNQPSQPSDLFWGAIAFTADGSYSSAWKMPSQPEAEAKVLRQCARFGRGGCEVVSFSGQQCVALTTFIGNYRRRRWNLSFTAGGLTYPEAQGAAMSRCNSDERTQGRCQPRTAACADGR